VILFSLSRLGWLAVLTRSAEPLVVGLLGLPAKTAQVLIMGFLRRDYGAAGLFAMARSGQLSGAQAVVALTVMTLFVPCVANFLMMIKEQGSRAAFAILGVVTVIAIGTGAGLNAALRVLHVTF
jgi:ferrous iron transport protein B